MDKSTSMQIKRQMQTQNKDWTGNKTAVFAALCASNHSAGTRAKRDYYATDPIAIDLLCGKEKFEGTIWENACGGGHLSKRLEQLRYYVISTDIADRGYGIGNVDFFKCAAPLGDNIITNPPYSFAKEWVYHSMTLLSEGKKLALFLPIQFLESEGRRKLLDTYNVKKIYTCTKRVLCGKNGDFRAKDKDGNVIYDKNGIAKQISSAKFYAWFVWEKGYTGDTTLIRL